MSKPKEKLAASLELLRQLQHRGTIVIRSCDLSRTHRERLLKNGFLVAVLRGWYLSSSPENRPGDSSHWYIAFWDFCAAYFQERFGENWSLSPEQSISLHLGNRTVPKQLVVRSFKGRNKETPLPFNISIFESRTSPAKNDEAAIIDSIRVFSLPAALCNVKPFFFQTYPDEARAALALIKESSELLAPLLKGDHSVIAGRLAGGLRSIGKTVLADEISRTMQSAGYVVRETNPFNSPCPYSPTDISPSAHRLHYMWHTMRSHVLEEFPPPPSGLNKNLYLKQLEENYSSDAYHSLSIEGFHVNKHLIERVRDGHWNPELNREDAALRDALAARGYWQAFQEVENSIDHILKGANAVSIVERDHKVWFQKLFAPNVQAGLLSPSDLIGYRRGQVYIRNSRHLPPKYDSVPELMKEFFLLLHNESNPAVRAVLGHFMFVYIHPYMDGNGRVGRFLMNAMLASGGYPWTIIHVDQRREYIEALEEAGIDSNARPLARFIAQQGFFS